MDCDWRFCRSPHYFCWLVGFRGSVRIILQMNGLWVMIQSNSSTSWNTRYPSLRDLARRSHYEEKFLLMSPALKPTSPPPAPSPSKSSAARPANSVHFREATGSPLSRRSPRQATVHSTGGGGGAAVGGDWEFDDSHNWEHYHALVDRWGFGFDAQIQLILPLGFFCF